MGNPVKWAKRDNDIFYDFLRMNDAWSEHLSTFYLYSANKNWYFLSQEVFLVQIIKCNIFTE